MKSFVLIDLVASEWTDKSSYIILGRTIKNTPDKSKATVFEEDVANMYTRYNKNLKKDEV